MTTFQFKKKYGQNFLSDPNLLQGICCDAGLTRDDNVLEIGAGAGALTKQICSIAKNVVSFEIDKQLENVLRDLNCKNLTLIFEDVLKVPTNEIEAYFNGSYKIVANLPYYITTPIIFKFLKEAKKLVSLTIMVQKEVAERICAKPGEKNYGLLSVSCAYFGQANIMRNVSRKMFFPQPDVDSCVVNLQIQKKDETVNQKLFFEVIKSAFKSRRKTLLNNLAEAFKLKKSKFSELNFDLSKRAEELSVDEFINLTKTIEKII